MKAFATLITILFFATALQAQPGKTKPAATKVFTCRDLKDSASYSLGYNIGQSLAERYSEMDPNVIAEAIKDAYEKKTSVVDVSVSQKTVQTFLMKSNAKKAAANKTAGKKFIDEIKKKPGVNSTASGLRYEVIIMGTGPKPTASDNVRVNYTGTLINGKEFDNSAKHGGSAQFNVSGVISGWTEALQLMPVGSKYKLYIPADLAYGDFDMGADIPAGSTLIFELELLEILK